MKKELETKDAKKMAIDAIKSMGEDDQFIVLTMKAKDNEVDQINHCEDMFVARFIDNTLAESEAMRKLCDYCRLKRRESDIGLGDFLERLAGCRHEDDADE